MKFILSIVLILNPLLFLPVSEAEEKEIESLIGKSIDLKELKSPNSNKKIELSENKDLDTNVSINDDIYILGIGDQLTINFINNKALTEEDRFAKFNIINDGTASVPFIGSIKLNGLTLNQAKKKITHSLNKQLLDPQITLGIVKPRSIRISVIGEVLRPGIYNSSESLIAKNDSFIESNPLTVVDAIKLAGGVTDRANLKKIVLRRILPSKELSFKQTELDLYDLLTSGNQSNNPYLFDGDVINITKTTNESIENFDILNTTISPEKIDVYIIGEVRKPGKISLTSNTPLIKAIYSAGGLNDGKVNKSNIQLIRVNKNGSTTRKRFRLNLNQGVSVENNPILKNGDLLIVNSNFIARSGKSFGAISEPVGDMLNVVTLIKLLNGSI